MVSGIIYVMKFVTGRADAGSARMLDAISAVVIGGTSLFGGTGSILGTVVGTLIIACLEIGLVNLAIPTFNLDIAVGGDSHICRPGGSIFPGDNL